MEVNKMKTLLTLIFTGILFFISVTTTAALDVVNNELLDQKHEQVLKMKLADDDLTIFLVDTSGNMKNADKFDQSFCTRKWASQNCCHELW